MNAPVFFALCSALLFVYIVPENECYAFDNPEFNEHLRQSLDEYMYEEDDEPRGKRDAGKDADGDDKFVCKHRHFKSCCGEENIMKKFHEKEKPVGKNCHRNVSAKFDELNVNTDRSGRDPMDFFSCEGMKNMKKKIYCVNECVGKAQKLLNEDGSLNVENIRVYIMGDGFKDDWMKDLVSSGLDTCLKKDFYKSTFPKEESTPTEPALDCNPTYLQFLSCLYKEVEMGCPDQYQKNNKKCKSMRDNFTKNKQRMLDLQKN